ncbi:MAG: mandelate racemase/muconate lactonizing enzyme family protein [Burkholderiales bacterium]|nr:mandelate racemase/muconate lactonizing enzyme family protein [Burkholderiales bacterium]
MAAVVPHAPIRSVRTVCYAQPMVPIHTGRFTGDLELTLTIVEAEDGRCGYSTARAHGGQPGTVIAAQVERSLAAVAIGRDASDPAALWMQMAAQEPPGYVSTFAIAALDVALWDLHARTRGLPLAHCLGGGRNAMRAYASSGHHADVDGYLKDFARARAAGFTAYKAHPFCDAARDIELAQVLRAAAGPGFRLMLDAAKRYTPEGALAVGRALQDLGFHWFEEPLPQHDWAGYRALRQALSIPVIGGETLPGLAPAVANAIDAGAYAAVLADVYWKGGVSGLLRTLALCRERGMPVVSHHGASPLMDLANLQVLCGASEVEMIEVLSPQSAYQYGLCAYLQVDADGQARLPDAAGLGALPDWDYIEKHRRS